MTWQFFMILLILAKYIAVNRHFVTDPRTENHRAKFGLLIADTNCTHVTSPCVVKTANLLTESDMLLWPLITVVLLLLLVIVQIAFETLFCISLPEKLFRNFSQIYNNFKKDTKLAFKKKYIYIIFRRSKKKLYEEKVINFNDFGKWK